MSLKKIEHTIWNKMMEYTICDLGLIISGSTKVILDVLVSLDIKQAMKISS